MGPSHVASLLLSAATTASSTRGVVVVVVVVGLQDLFPQFLFALVDIGVQAVAVLPDRELLVVVDRDVDAPSAHWLVLRVVELSHVRVPQGLFGG